MYLFSVLYTYICRFWQCSFDQHLLEETTLRTKKKHSCLPHMQEIMSLPFSFFQKHVLLFHVPVYIYGVFFQMIVCENIERYLFLVYMLF